MPARPVMLPMLQSHADVTQSVQSCAMTSVGTVQRAQLKEVLPLQD